MRKGARGEGAVAADAEARLRDEGRCAALCTRGEALLAAQL